MVKILNGVERHDWQHLKPLMDALDANDIDFTFDTSNTMWMDLRYTNEYGEKLCYTVHNSLSSPSASLSIQAARNQTTIKESRLTGCPTANLSVAIKHYRDLAKSKE